MLSEAHDSVCIVRSHAGLTPVPLSVKTPRVPSFHLYSPAEDPDLFGLHCTWSTLDCPEHMPAHICLSPLAVLHPFKVEVLREEAVNFSLLKSYLICLFWKQIRATDWLGWSHWQNVCELLNRESDSSAVWIQFLTAGWSNCLSAQYSPIIMTVVATLLCPLQRSKSLWLPVAQELSLTIPQEFCLTQTWIFLLYTPGQILQQQCWYRSTEDVGS